MILLLVSGTLTPLGHAAFEGSLVSPRTAAMGGAGIALIGDPWGFERNPALAETAPLRVAVGWSRLFGIPELSRESVTLTSAFRNLSWGMRGTTFGSDLYRETGFGLAVARTLHPMLVAGAGISGQWLQIRNYNRGGAVAIDAGLLVRPTKDLSLGAAWRNLNEPRIRGYRERIVESLSVGAAWRLGDDGTIAADILQEPRHEAEYRIGAEAKVMPLLRLRVGMRAEPVRPSAGLELIAGRWQFVYAADVHPDLGSTHELGLAMRWRQ